MQGTATTTGIPGLVDAYYTLKEKPELHVEIDRERAASLGVDVEEIAGTLRIAVGGDDRASRWQDPVWGEVYDVELRLVGVDRDSADAISQLYVRSKALRRQRQRRAKRHWPATASRKPRCPA